MWQALKRTAAALATLLVLAAALAIAEQADQQAANHAQSKQRLAQLQQLVGSWRGVGQPQRGSIKDSWIEDSDWAWSFGKDGPALVTKLSQGKFFKRMALQSGGKSGQFVLVAAPAGGGEPIEYSGNLNDQQQLVLTAREPRDNLPERLSFRFVAEGNRLLILMEKRSAGGGSFARLAEVGYTRQGSGFGKVVTERECVVTGGQGTIAVTHNGQTHFVCCTGCRDYFNEQPDKVLAEYEARKAEEKQK
jgi:hypothetical protein